MADSTHRIPLDRRVARAKYVYEQVDEWLEHVNSKVGTTCGLFVGIFGLVSLLAERYVPAVGLNTQAATNVALSPIHSVCFVGSLLVLTVALFFYMCALAPGLTSGATSRSTQRGQSPLSTPGFTSGSDSRGEKPFLLRYDDVARADIAEFRKAIHMARDIDFLNEIIDEAHRNAVACSKKMSRYRVAVLLSFAAIALEVAGWIVRYLMYA